MQYNSNPMKVEEKLFGEKKQHTKKFPEQILVGAVLLKGKKKIIFLARLLILLLF